MGDRFSAAVYDAAAVEVCARTGAVRISGESIALGRRQRELVFLLASEQRPFSTVEIADSLWPESDGDRAVGALRVAVRRVRQALGAHSIESVGGGYALGLHVRRLDGEKRA